MMTMTASADTLALTTASNTWSALTAAPPGSPAGCSMTPICARGGMSGGGIGDGAADMSGAGDGGVESPPEPTSPEPGEGGASPEPTSPGPSDGGDDGGRGEGHCGEGGGRGGAGEFGRDMGTVTSPEPTSLEPGGGGSEAAEAVAGRAVSGVQLRVCTKTTSKQLLVSLGKTMKLSVAENATAR